MTSKARARKSKEICGRTPQSQPEHMPTKTLRTKVSGVRIFSRTYENPLF
nr:MAG TPA: hypothetical protein [Caudoviricetes sp.]